MAIIRAADAAAERRVREVLEIHERAAQRLIETRGVTAVRRLYDQLEAELARKLDALVREGKGDRFTAAQARGLLAQVRAAQLAAIPRASSLLGEQSREAQIASVRNLVREVTVQEAEFNGATVVLPIEEAAQFAGIIDADRASLLRVHRASFTRYGSAVVDAVQQRLSVVLATGGTALDAVRAVQDETGAQFWRAERIVRTEMSFAYNAAHMRGLEASRDLLPDMGGRWTERVDDFTGQPLDNRVAADSLVLHGQVARPVGLDAGRLLPDAKQIDTTLGGEAPLGGWEMPRDNRVNAKLWGRRYSQPPNRPNDRSRVVAWRASWGRPGYVVRGGERVPITSAGAASRLLTE
jgi:hypothetical protein